MTDMLYRRFVTNPLALAVWGTLVVAGAIAANPNWDESAQDFHEALVDNYLDTAPVLPYSLAKKDAQGNRLYDSAGNQLPDPDAVDPANPYAVTDFVNAVISWLEQQSASHHGIHADLTLEAELLESYLLEQSGNPAVPSVDQLEVVADSYFVAIEAMSNEAADLELDMQTMVTLLEEMDEDDPPELLALKYAAAMTAMQTALAKALNLMAKDSDGNVTHAAANYCVEASTDYAAMIDEVRAYMGKTRCTTFSL